MANILFDLDGTLINSQHRLYNLFVELCPECELTYDEYWRIKREGVTQKDLLNQYYNYDYSRCLQFKKLWLEKIEEPFRLEQDFLVEGIEQVLNIAKLKHSLYIITNRQSNKHTINEIELLGIKHYFKGILVTEQKIDKADLIGNSIPIRYDDVLVGDAVEDIEYAKKLGIISCAVSWGITSYNRLINHSPYIAVCNNLELLDFLRSFE